MSLTNPSNHYERLAKNYDGMWTHSDQFIDWMSRAILSSLNPQPCEIIIDLGGGTGIYASRLAKILNCTSGVVSVDPSKEMAYEAHIKKGVTSVIGTAEDFLRAAARASLGPVFMKEAIHHIADRPSFFHLLRHAMSSQGRFCLLLLTEEIEYPLFKSALELHTKNQPTRDQLHSELADAGFKIDFDIISTEISVKKQSYINMVSNRYMSVLSEFSQIDLDHGLAEIAEKHTSDGKFVFKDKFMTFVCQPI